MLDQISNVYIGSNISSRLYSVNDLVWPDTTGNLWKVIDNPYNKTISNFNVTYIGGQVDINWGTVISGNISSGTNINHTFSGITNSGISVLARNGANITNINCGISSPKLSGIINLSAFPNLTDFICINNDITAINGYENNPNLISIIFNTNQVTGSIPSLSSMTSLTFFICYRNNLIGSIPSLSFNTPLKIFLCDNNALTGQIPSLSSNTALTQFQCNSNQIVGSIPSLSANTQLTNFACQFNQLTGSIPSLSANNNLQIFFCYNQLGGTKLTSFDGGSVSNTLGNFQAQTNQLNSTAVNAILAAFVAANKTTGTRILNLGGAGNSAPTGQGITDKATLISRGWTVTTN